MYLKTAKLDEDSAKKICSWKYEGEYSVYNYPEWDIIKMQNWAITIEEKREKEFVVVVNENDELCGYMRLINCNDYILVGLGLRPDLCGQGIGRELMELLKQECKNRYGNKKIVLEVRSFNKRAIRCYEKSGFKIIDRYFKESMFGADEYIKMEYYL